MADNVAPEAVVSAAAFSFATDDITTVHYPIIKLAHGALDSATIVSTSSGLPVQMQGTWNITNAGTFAVQVDGSALTALQKIDDPVLVDDAVFTPATSSVMMAGFTFDDVAPDSVNEGDAGAARMSANRNVYVQIRDAAGNERGLNVDANGAIAVTDGGGALTVDGTVAISGNVTVNSHAVTNAGTFATQIDGAALTALQLIDDVVFADDAAFTLTSSKAVAVGAIRDDSLGALSAAEGDIVPLRVSSTGALHVTGGGGGTQYNIDDVASATAAGTVALVVRKDSAASLAGTDGDITGLQVDANGALRVTGGGGGTEYTVDAAAPAAPTGATFVMERDDTLSALTEVEGDWTNPRASANGALWVSVDGTVTVGSHAVTNAGTFATQESGALLTAAQLIDDIVYTDDTSTHSTGTSKGALFMAAATPTDASVNANDIGAVAMTTDRKLHVAVMDALPAGTNAIGKLAANSGVDIGDVDILSIVPGTGATNLGKAEDVAHNSGDTGVYALAVRDDTLGAHSNAEGDYESLHTTADGALWVTQAPSAIGGLTIFRSIDLDETEEEVKATAGVVYSISAFNRTAAPLYLKFYNLTAANTTVGTSTPVATFIVPANADSDGAGFVWNNTIGLGFSTAISAAVTTGVADADTGAPGANDCVVVIGYK